MVAPRELEACERLVLPVIVTGGMACVDQYQYPSVHHSKLFLNSSAMYKRSPPVVLRLDCDGKIVDPTVVRTRDNTICNRML